MKKLILCFVGFPLASTNFPFSERIVEVRSGEWPISLAYDRENPQQEYFLEFRDQQVLTGVVLDTLPLANIQQVKYLGQALSALKTGHSGDIAKFKDYSIKRTDSTRKDHCYLLRYKWGLTNFKQAEADILINSIRNL
jgi:hypothetical protein